MVANCFQTLRCLAMMGGLQILYFLSSLFIVISCLYVGSHLIFFKNFFIVGIYIFSTHVWDVSVLAQMLSSCLAVSQQFLSSSLPVAQQLLSSCIGVAQQLLGVALVLLSTNLALTQHLLSSCLAIALKLHRGYSVVAQQQLRCFLGFVLQLLSNCLEVDQSFASS